MKGRRGCERSEAEPLTPLLFYLLSKTINRTTQLHFLLNKWKPFYFKGTFIFPSSFQVHVQSQLWVFFFLWGRALLSCLLELNSCRGSPLCERRRGSAHHPGSSEAPRDTPRAALGIPLLGPGSCTPTWECPVDLCHPGKGEGAVVLDARRVISKGRSSLWLAHLIFLRDLQQSWLEGAALTPSGDPASGPGWIRTLGNRPWQPSTSRVAQGQTEQCPRTARCPGCGFWQHCREFSPWPRCSLAWRAHGSPRRGDTGAPGEGTQVPQGSREHPRAGFVSPVR